jgi:hypothetical protein
MRMLTLTRGQQIRFVGDGMAHATGTLAWINEFLSDEPTDIDTIRLRVVLIAKAISVIANDIEAKMKQTPGGVLDATDEEQANVQVNALNRELERLLKLANQLQK